MTQDLLDMASTDLHSSDIPPSDFVVSPSAENSHQFCELYGGLDIQAKQGKQTNIKKDNDFL